MKKYISLLVLTLWVVASCVDNRYDEMINDSIYFPKSDLQEQTVTVMNAEDYTYEIWVHKGGYYQDKFNGSIALDYNYLVEYNTANGTNYEMLDEKYYTFDRSFTIEKDVNEKAVPLTLKTNSVLEDMGYGTYYIPFSLSSTSAKREAYAEKGNLLLAITFQQPILTIDGENKGEVLLDLSTVVSDTYDVDITSILDVRTPEELEVVYSIDLSLLNEGEKVLDAQHYSFTGQVTMPVDEQYAENFLTLQLTDMPRGRWIVPVRLSTTNTKVKVADDAYLKLTVVSGTLDDIQWAGDYLQKDEIIVSSATLTDALIATAEGVDAEVSADQPWLDVAMKADGNIYMTITEANTSTNTERIATVTILDKGTLLEKTIKVRQCMSGYGIILNKSSWSIAAYSNNVADKTSQFGRLFDNFWPANGTESGGSYIELNNRTDGSDPFVLTFDLGEVYIEYNSLGLMPRLQWTQPAPKRVKIEVSDDMNNWTVLGPNAGTTGIWSAFTEEELKNGGTSWDNHYEGVVHWFDLGPQRKRYIRLSMYEGFYQDTGKVICLNEVFVSKR